MSAIKPTPEQQAAIEYPGSMVAIAKPGSGKTFVMSEKIRSVLPTIANHQGIIAISYTNKASEELKRRSARNGINQKCSFFGTIDKFCDGEIIIPFLPQLWGKPKNEIVIRRIKDLEKEEQEQFSNIQSNQVSLEDLINHLEILCNYFKIGNLFLETNGALALYTLTKSVACQNYIKSRYNYVLIDEYQDSGLEQHELFIKLKELGLIAIAVGDADQSIFGFSGKDSRFLLELAKRDDYKSFPISYNHRCHPSIINYSQRLLNKNSALLQTDEVRVFEKSCIGTQAAIAKWIDLCIPKLIQKYGIEKYSEIGVLVRGGISGKIINDTLNVKHRYFTNHPIEEHFSLWARLFCQLLQFRFDNSITAQEIIDSSTTILSVNEVRSIRQAISKVRTVGNDDLIGCLESIASVLLPNARSVEALTLLETSIGDDLSLYFEPAKNDEVQVMTIHKAKGLEFDIVFHLDLYEWAFPAKRPGPMNDFDNPGFPTLAQDVNLYYVGITRAKKACFLCTSTKRVKKSWEIKGLEIKNGSPSEFLKYIRLLSLKEGAQI